MLHEFIGKDLIVELPTWASNIDGIENDGLNLNDQNQIRIKRDRKWCEKVYKMILTEYKAMLYKWFKGIDGGSGDSTMFIN